MSAEPGRRLGHSAPKEDPKPRVACTPLVAHNLGAMASVVELRGARKRFGQVEAVKGVDLAIGAGEMVALLGPNGAGKTTSISLMLGLRRPTAGEALLFGLHPEDRRARSRCGVMLQESGTTGCSPSPRSWICSAP